jgi:hypothetical protein
MKLYECYKTVKKESKIHECLPKYFRSGPLDYVIDASSCNSVFTAIGSSPFKCNPSTEEGLANVVSAILGNFFFYPTF